VFVEGSLQTRKWQDQQGQDPYTTEIKASRVQFHDRRGEAGGKPADEGDAPRKTERKQQNEDLGPAFPSEASGMDDMPF
jgi:single-strand DNA-binding protein